MKLSLIHEGNKENLGKALRFIYGHNARPMGIQRPKLHQTKDDVIVDKGNRTMGARAYDPGIPWKLRHRRFFTGTHGGPDFRMSNDGAQALRF